MKQRIITGTIAAAVLAVSLLLYETLFFPLITAAVGAIAVYELTCSTKLIDSKAIGIICGCIAALLILSVKESLIKSGAQIAQSDFSSDCIEIS